mmetsp:Transcript_5917/g.9187  ORF Transcript_5917/g.9187 Transcript_5917/m.9187 type:complete len:599 (+) Transcript_5917:126-1922(+)
MEGILSGFLKHAKQNQSLSAFTVTVISLVLFKRVYRYLKLQNRRKELRALATKKRNERDELLTKMEETLLAGDLKNDSKITHLSASELLRKLEKGEVTSLEVTMAFCRTAARVQKDLSCLAEINFEEAIALARERDKERKEGKIRGPLHGLPISIKDQIDMAGFDSTCGLSARCYRPAIEDAVIVQILRAAGAIPFVRTNIPQALFLPESVNAIWGCCKNPFNAKRTSGGSSGGEASLLAARGSPLGLGTDIAGSIRGPSLFCGICGFKPTPGRVSCKGIAVPRPNDSNGQAVVLATPGPMARCVDDLELVMRVWHEDGKMHNDDSVVPPLSWKSNIYTSSSKKKLKFGYFTDDGYFDSCAAAKRAVIETVEALKEAGHEVVELKFNFEQLCWSFVKLMSAEGGLQGFIDSLEGEELNPIYLFLYKTANIPTFLRPFLAKIMDFTGQNRIGGLVREARPRSTYDYWSQNATMKLQKKALIKKWEELKLDAVVCPPGGVPAMPHGMSSKLAQASSYTFLWNIVHFPAGVVPTTLVRADEEKYEGRKDSITAAAKIAGVDSRNMPMGVQVVTLPWKDELCLRAMKIVEDVVKWKIPNPLA